MAYGYIQKLNEHVFREHVRFNDRYGIAIAADIYRAKNLDASGKYPALIVGAPYGGVKEQGPCVYANELAQRGFVVLTFDQVHMGESGGEPRNVSSPDLFAEYEKLFAARQIPIECIPHAKMLEMTAECKAAIRTGENRYHYSSVLLVCGCPY